MISVDFIIGLIFCRLYIIKYMQGHFLHEIDFHDCNTFPSSSDNHKPVTRHDTVLLSCFLRDYNLASFTDFYYPEYVFSLR